MGLLVAQDASRVAELVPIRYGRMLASPFSFFRGAAAVMAADLAALPVTGVEVQVCGDAHLANFGLYASPERHLVFDVNDFDETLPGPWEWDVKRLAASVVLAARERSLPADVARSAASAAARAYRQSMAVFAGLSTLDVWYWHIDVDADLAVTASGSDAAASAATGPPSAGASSRPSGTVPKQVRKAVAKAHAHDTAQAVSKLTEVVDGRRRFVARPPLVVPVDLGDVPELRVAFDGYVGSLLADRRCLLERFSFADAARKVVGVGSVGTRCSMLLFSAGDGDDPLLLQVKEAQASVLEAHWRPSRCPNHAERVVVGQRLMQAETDVFLGWTHRDGDGVDYYVRQLRDMKGSVDLSSVSGPLLESYASVCGTVLARAHARSGDPSLLSGYLGSSPGDPDRPGVFDEAIAGFAVAYADQSERDFANLEAAARVGRVPVERGV